MLHYTKHRGQPQQVTLYTAPGPISTITLYTIHNIGVNLNKLRYTQHRGHSRQVTLYTVPGSTTTCYATYSTKAIPNILNSLHHTQHRCHSHQVTLYTALVSFSRFHTKHRGQRQQFTLHTTPRPKQGRLEIIVKSRGSKRCHLKTISPESR